MQDKYKSHVEPKLELIKGWARDGLTDEQIAKNLGISCSSLNNYKTKHLEFLESLKESKDFADLQVENALYKRALGYSYTETTKESNCENGIMMVTKKVTKEVVPDVTAQIYWLKNRKPKQWRDRVDVPPDSSCDKLADLCKAIKEAAKK